MLFELHITVSNHCYLQDWVGFCNQVGVKPLAIELESETALHPTQYMFAAVLDGSNDDAYWWRTGLERKVSDAGFEILRSKLEVPLDKSAIYNEPPYFECHVKSLIPKENVEDIVFDAGILDWFASRNALYPSFDGLEKWYFTKRTRGVDYRAAAKTFAESFADLPQIGFEAIRMESETVIYDTNEGLDAGWT